MESFSQVLVRIRLTNGFKTSKSFFNYLITRGLECNYQYYVKIEKGGSFPSSQVINQIAKAVKKEDGEEIILSYCSQQFESFNYLFSSGEHPTPYNDQMIEDKKIAAVEQGQKELTPKQVAMLRKKKENYFLFLIVTLSRRSIEVEEFIKYPQLKTSIKNLVEVGIITLDKKIITARSPEFRFPKTKTSEMAEAYEHFDEWDVEFSNQFGFKKYLNKMMIRRISPRYFNVMLKQIEAFTDFVRCSDESDQKYNKDVLHLHIRISKGELPG